MTIEIWAGGQTGVDLGAHLAALDCGIAIGGFMPADGYNEEGPIPEAIAIHLRRHTSTNPAARTLANIGGCDAALVIVEDRRRAGATRGTALTIRTCEKRERRDARFRFRVIDPAWPPETVAFLTGKWPRPTHRPFRLMVAGPRASLWPEGEAQAKRFVWAICKAVRS